MSKRSLPVFYIDETMAIDLELPNECPLCHAKISPDHLYSCTADTLFSKSDHDLIYSIFACPNCHNLFYAYYQFEREGMNHSYRLHRYGPKQPLVTDFSDEIKHVSPTFVEIFTQSEAAEEYHLNQIAGAGYRKALEFLVKDYACLLNPDEEEKIKASLLKPCIEQFIDFKKIKDLATVATWLGNDETHYLRKWNNLDIQDMKRFIQACVSLIQADMNAAQCSEIISSRKSDL